MPTPLPCRDCLFWKGRHPPIEEGAHVRGYRPCTSKHRPGFSGQQALVGPRDRVVTAPDATCHYAAPRPLAPIPKGRPAP